MSSQSRVEIVRVKTGWIGRLIAGNSKEVWRTSEVYTRRRGVVRAIELLNEPVRIVEVGERD